MKRRIIFSVVVTAMSIAAGCFFLGDKFNTGYIIGAVLGTIIANFFLPFD